MEDLEIKHSHRNYDSTMAPFFRPHENEDVIENTSESIIGGTADNNIDLLNRFKNLKVSQDIVDFYANNNGHDRELYIDGWTIFPLTKILEIQEEYEKDNIKNIVNIGFRYSGMGWIKLAFYDTKLKKILYRMDGGSNGYDRIDNYNKLKSYQSDRYINDGIEFAEFLRQTANMDSENDCIKFNLW